MILQRVIRHIASAPHQKTIRDFREVLRVAVSRKEVSASIITERLRVNECDWEPTNEIFEVRLTSKMGFIREWDYYDAPLGTLHIGPLKITQWGYTPSKRVNQFLFGRGWGS